MPIKFLQRKLPKADDIKRNPYLQIFGKRLHDENLWRLNRSSISKAIFIGLFWACIPIPFQMIAAAGCAILFRANLPLSVALVWISNPITMPPMFYFNYVIGLKILGESAHPEKFELSMEWLTHSLSDIWQPLYLGSFSVGLIAGLIGLLILHLLWRIKDKT